MPTPTERRIIQERRARARGSRLVLALEELLEREVEPEDEEDFRFLEMLLRARAIPRSKGVFSPSMLGSCMRQAYFAKTGVDPHKAHSPQTNGYFLHGNFIHLKWQFALWKAHREGLIELVTVSIDSERATLLEMRENGDLSLEEYDAWVAALNFYGDGTRPAVEIRVRSKAGDFSGTIDAIIRIVTRYYLVDFKGINLIDYQRALKKGAKFEYRVQVVGYAMIVNGSDEFDFTIKQCLLVSECKAGPISGRGSPLALHEAVVDVDDYKDEVRNRLKRLREHVAEESIPAPACVSTRHQSYQECPFNRLCLEEVRRIQSKREKAAGSSKRNWQVARP